jgi:hypothetical protein
MINEAQRTQSFPEARKQKTKTNTSLVVLNA